MLSFEIEQFAKNGEHGADEELLKNADDDAPIAYRPVKTTKTAARADVAVDDDR